MKEGNGISSITLETPTTICQDCFCYTSKMRICLFLLCFHFTIQAQPSSKKWAFFEKIKKHFDNDIKPNVDEDIPTVVQIDMYLVSFDSVHEASMDYSVTMFLRQKWTDDRLKFNVSVLGTDHLFFDQKLAEKIWVPDLFFFNEKMAQFHQVTVPNKLLKIQHDGQILYSMRLSASLSCQMNLRKFPLDTQVCYMELESYGYTTKDLIFIWSENPIELPKRLEIAQYAIDKVLIGNCTKHYNTGEFTCIKVEFVLQRDVGFYLVQYYIPGGLLVMLSWVSFWINFEAVPARISLGVLTILTMTTQSTGVRNNLPPVSYVKALDIWMSVCLICVFAALLEFALVNVMSRKLNPKYKLLVKQNLNLKRRHTLKTSYEMNPMILSDEFVPNSSTYTNKTKNKETPKKAKEKSSRADQIDKLSRFLFPGVFIAFNIFYWSYFFLWKSEDERHSGNRHVAERCVDGTLKLSC